MDNFALDKADDSIKALLSYKYEESLGTKIQKLDNLVSNLDYEEAKELATEILNQL